MQGTCQIWFFSITREAAMPMEGIGDAYCCGHKSGDIGIYDTRWEAVHSYAGDGL
ncbi:MAG: hypothetical protein ACLR6J_10125 [Parabacteroides merdae]